MCCLTTAWFQFKGRYLGMDELKGCDFKNDLPSKPLNNEEELDNVTDLTGNIITSNKDHNNKDMSFV